MTRLPSPHGSGHAVGTRPPYPLGDGLDLDGALVALFVDEEGGGAADAALAAGVVVLLDAAAEDAGVEGGLELVDLQAELQGVVGQVGRVEGGLVLVEQVVHGP